MLTRGTSLVYFTNIRWGGGERLFACVIPVKGEPFFVCPAFEEDRAHEQIELGPFGGGHGRRPDLAGRREPLRARRAAACKDRGVATGTLGIEETTKFVWSDSVAAGRAAAEGRQRHAHHRRLPDDQGRARNRADAARVAGDAEGVRGGLPRARSRA